MSYTFGADPELFVFNTRTNKFVSAYGLIPGTKAKPHPVEHGAVQLDGMAAEFNIDPVDNLKNFIRNIKSVKRQLTEMVKQHNPDFVLVAKPTATFDQDYFDAAPQSTKELGCDPDYCASTGQVNPRPDPGNKPFRTGGGHIHIGWTSGMSSEDIAHFNDCRVVIKSLYNSGLNRDYLWDDDSQRRSLYGSKFSFRPKSFGVEYRYLSNAWVENEDAMKYIFNIAKNVMENLDREYGGVVKPDIKYSTPVPKKLLDTFKQENPTRGREDSLSYIHLNTNIF